MGILENFCIENTNTAISNAIIILCILLAAGPVLKIYYIPLFGYAISVPLIISYILSAYLIYSIIVGLINLAKGNKNGSYYMFNAFLMWAPTIVINGLGYITLIQLINWILGFFLKIIH